MKKILFLLTFIFAVALTQAQVVYPLGEASAVTLKATATDTFSVANTMTIASLNDTLHTALTYVVNAQTGIRTGSLLLIVTRCGAIVHTVTWGTGFTGIATTGTANKTKNVLFLFNGTKFVELSQTQIN